MFNILVASDNEWKYSFPILMIVILVLCGVYVTFKVIRQNKQKQNPIDVTKKDDKFTQAVLDNEDIIIQKKNK